MRKRTLLIVMLLWGTWTWSQDAPPLGPEDGETTPVQLVPLADLEPLVTEFNQTPSGNRRKELSATLTLQVKDRVDELVKLVAEAKGNERLRAVELLGFTRSPQAAATLAPLTRDADRQIAHRALTALGVNGERSSIPALMEALEGADKERAGRAAVALGRIGDKSVRERLTAELALDDLTYRLRVIHGLGELRDPLSMPALENVLLRSRNPLEQVAVYDAMNLALGDDPFRIVEQLDRIALILSEEGPGWPTQLAQAAVTDALDRMIRDAEKKKEKSGGKKKEQKKPKQQTESKTGAGGGGGASTSSGSSSAGGSTPAQGMSAGASRPPGALGGGDAVGVTWGNLPPAVREEVTAALQRDLPERYRKFLEIYLKILAEGK